MSNSSTEIRVRLRHANHPTGERRRAGFVFGVQPIVVEVTEEQLEAIKADQYLQILPNKGVLPESEGDDGEDGDPVVTEVKLDRATKPQLIEILTNELKLVPGVDFNPEASNAILKQLVADLRAKAADGTTGNDEDDDDQDDDDSDDDAGEDEGK